MAPYNKKKSDEPEDDYGEDYATDVLGRLGMYGGTFSSLDHDDEDHDDDQEPYDNEEDENNYNDDEDQFHDDQDDLEPLDYDDEEYDLDTDEVEDRDAEDDTEDRGNIYSSSAIKRQASSDLYRTMRTPTTTSIDDVERPDAEYGIDLSKQPELGAEPGYVGFEEDQAAEQQQEQRRAAAAAAAQQQYPQQTPPSPQQQQQQQHQKQKAQQHDGGVSALSNTHLIAYRTGAGYLTGAVIGTMTVLLTARTRGPLGQQLPFLKTYWHEISNSASSFAKWGIVLGTLEVIGRAVDRAQHQYQQQARTAGATATRPSLVHSNLNEEKKH